MASFPVGEHGMLRPLPRRITLILKAEASWKSPGIHPGWTTTSSVRISPGSIWRSRLDPLRQPPALEPYPVPAGGGGGDWDGLVLPANLAL